jgi:hypothetical protein
LSSVQSHVLATSVCVVLGWGYSSYSAFAHNNVVHRDIVDLAYEIMMMASDDFSQPVKARSVAVQPPNTVNATWEQFLSDLAKARLSIRSLRSGLHDAMSADCPLNNIRVDQKWAFDRALGEMPYAVALDWFDGGNCGIDFGFAPRGIYAGHNQASSGSLIPPTPPHGIDYSGGVLGFWAAKIDDHVDDTHLFTKPTSMVGIGAATTKADELITSGLTIPLVPLFCVAECIFGDCDRCDSNARDFADSINPTDEVLGLIPGLGDKSGPDYVGVWHFIGMHPGAPGTFDDRPGYLIDHGGPEGQPDALAIDIMALSDLMGLTLNYHESDGPRQYEVAHGNDFHPNTKPRSAAQWMFPTFPHLIFEPVDNLAKYGWDVFRMERASAAPLGWPLHAIGDATVPMHVVGASGWGHRPFEDAIEDAWPRLVYLTDRSDQARESNALQIQQARSVSE